MFVTIYLLSLYVTFSVISIPAAAFTVSRRVGRLRHLRYVRVEKRKERIGREKKLMKKLYNDVVYLNLLCKLIKH